MSDVLDRRLREGLQEAAAFEPDTAAARTRFDTRRRQQRLLLWTGTGVLAAAGVAALALALVGSGSGSRVGLTANGGPRGQETTSTSSQPVAGFSKPLVSGAMSPPARSRSSTWWSPIRNWKTPRGRPS